MRFRLNPTRSQLKVFASVFADLGAAWIIAIFLTPNLFTLTFNIVCAILSIYLSIKIEDLLKDYD